ncbi:MAG TPA: hypothetical protein VN985_03840 [Candidatus Eisenbacteria bacterium]|nr:hypothetical protein [Candidatus Eisenbacteria bacterium]
MDWLTWSALILIASVLIACAFLGLFLAVSSATVMSKVRYAYFGRTVKQR